jgi:hypothetical protein
VCLSPANSSACFFVFKFFECESIPFPPLQVIQNKTFISRFNDSELSKMDMGPLWTEMLETEAPFSLISGHDSTIYPLMTSLGERVWNATDFPPYASMMLIEVGETRIGFVTFSRETQNKSWRVGRTKFDSIRSPLTLSQHYALAFSALVPF